MTSISVALCTYNGAEFLSAQLQSIVEQSRRPDEIVISDDLSDDVTRSVVERFASDSPVLVKVLPSDRRRGVTANFERAIAATRGDFVALSDQDDVWHHSHVEKLAARLEADDRLLLVHSDALLVDSEGNSLGATLFDALRVRADEKVAIQEGRPLDALLRRNLVTGATTMLRRSLAERARPFPATWVHDEWLAIVAALSGAVGLVDEPLLNYRQHGSNEIGARVMSFSGLIGRLTATDRSRHARLSQQWSELARRAAPLGASEGVESRVNAKWSFETRRAGFSASRVRRLSQITRELVRRDYGRYASQRTLDALRDLLA